MGPGKCDAEVSELVSRGDFARQPDRLTVLENRYYEVLGRLTALEARVYQGVRPVPLVDEESRKAKAEADQKALETEVELGEEYNDRWLNL